MVESPFAAFGRPREEGRALSSKRTLRWAQWDLIDSRVKVELKSESAAARRCAFKAGYL